MSVSNIRVLPVGKERDLLTQAPEDAVCDGLRAMLRREAGGLLPADVKLLSKLWPTPEKAPTPAQLRAALDTLEIAGVVKRLVLGSAWHIRLVDSSPNGAAAAQPRGDAAAEVRPLAQVVELRRATRAPAFSEHPEAMRARYESDTLLQVWAEALPASEDELDRAFDDILSVGPARLDYAAAQSENPPADSVYAAAQSEYSPDHCDSVVPAAPASAASRRHVTPLALPAVESTSGVEAKPAEEVQRLTLTSPLASPILTSPGSKPSPPQSPHSQAAVSISEAVALAVSVEEGAPLSGVSTPMVAESTVAALAAAIAAAAPLLAGPASSVAAPQAGEEERAQFKVDVELDVAHERLLLYRVVVVLEVIVALVMARQALLLWLHL